MIIKFLSAKKATSLIEKKKYQSLLFQGKKTLNEYSENVGTISNLH